MSLDPTIDAIVTASTWGQRIAQIRLVPSKHGTEHHDAIYAAVARQLYVKDLAPDFAYIHEAPFYETPHFFAAYGEAERLTAGFTKTSEEDIRAALIASPITLLVFRTILGLVKAEFAHSTQLVAEALNLKPLTQSQVDSLERGEAKSGRQVSKAALAKLTLQAEIAAKTIAMIMNGQLFGEAQEGLKTKQEKPDTADGWTSVHAFARDGVPFKTFLHQRHYGGAFRQVLDATSVLRGNLIEDAVEALFKDNGISYIKTGSHNQKDIKDRFEVSVAPTPDFVVFDPVDDSLKAMLECKGTNDGGTARDKANRFKNLRAESIRLGGVPLFAVLGGIGWARITDALGPVIRDTEGRAFTMSTLTAILEVQPFPGLIRAQK